MICKKNVRGCIGSALYRKERFMLTKKVLMNTLGAKIAPYGFGYDGFEGNVWRFLRTINGEKQYINVKKKNDYSFNVHLPSRLRKCDLGDLVCHSCKNDEELTALLNLLGDHIIRRALPELEKPAPEEVRLGYKGSQEMSCSSWSGTGWTGNAGRMR